LKAAQFYKGIINGIADSYESPDLFQVLPADKLSVLWDIDRVGTYNHVFLSEHVVTKTVVTQAVPDELGRSGTINHTILYRFDPNIEHNGVRYVFPEEQFKIDARTGKYQNIKMPPAPELKRPLDYPPPMEVQ